MARPRRTRWFVTTSRSNLRRPRRMCSRLESAAAVAVAAVAVAAVANNSRLEGEEVAMRANYGMRNRQRGAVAVIMGIAAVALFAFMGIAVDLAYTYSRKTELQNGADAAALSGAKELNQKLSGLTGTPLGQPCSGTNIGAIKRAICTFDQNNTSNFVGSTFHITIANLRLGSCPNPDDVLPLRLPSCTFVAASSVTTDAAASNKSFLEVRTPNQTRNTFFMLVAGTTTPTTLGYSVAGRFVTDVTPIGICGIDPGPPATKKYTYPGGATELVEL